MLFSIIVPIYKVEKYLNQCVESVLTQSFKDFELVLVDDGSPDDSPRICDDYALKDNRVKVIHKVNGGLVSARKAGAKIAQGDYCIALDGDDWIAEDSLKYINDVIERYHPDVIRFGFVSSYDDERRILKPITSFRKGYYSRSDIEREIIPWVIYGANSIEFPHSVCGGAVKRHLYVNEQMEVPDKIMIGEDSVLMHPIHIKANSIYVMKDCLYYYRCNYMSMTKNRKPFILENALWRAEHHAKRLDLTQYDLQAQLDRSTVHSLFNACLTRFWQDKGYSKIKKEIISALNIPLYVQSLNRVNYKLPYNRKLMPFVLKHHLIFVLWLYSKLKKFK